MRSQGWRLTLIDGFVSGNDTLFNAVWRKSTADQIDIYGWGFNDFVNKAQQLESQGYRFHLIDSYELPDHSRRYNASWRRGGSNDLWILSLAPQDFENEYAELHAQGWTLHGLTASGVGYFRRFDAFWRQTGVQEIRYNSMDVSTFLELDNEYHYNKDYILQVFERN